MARSKKNKTSIGCLFWIALILLVLVIFLFNRETIQKVLDETGFLEVVRNNDEESEPEVEQIIIPEETGSEKAPAAPEVTAVEGNETPESERTDETVVALEVEPEKPDSVETPSDEPEQNRKVRRSKMYFIQINDDGEIGLKSIVRPVYYIDSPLTETIKTLLDGLSSSELNMGLISLIPEQTELLSINLKSGTAYLNFSDSFRFNSFGVEGYNAQLKQIVYTVTEFANIESVQILIEGSIIDYMGPEGGYIGKPISRNTFTKQ